MIEHHWLCYRQYKTILSQQELCLLRAIEKSSEAYFFSVPSSIPLHSFVILEPLFKRVCVLAFWKFLE